MLDQDIATERSVLGSILIDCHGLPPAVGMVSPSDFLVQHHRLVFLAMLELSEDDEPIDLVTVADKLKGQSTPKKGWTSFLAELTDEIPTSANVEHYANILRGQARRRDFVVVMSKALERSKDKSVDGDDLMSSAVSELCQLADQRAMTRPIPIKEIMKEEFKAIESRAGGEVLGVPTGYHSLDELTGGLPNAGLIIVAARPSMGKSAFAAGLLRNTAIVGKRSGLLFSLEMTREEQADRFLALDARVDLRRIRSGKFRDADYPKMANAVSRIYESKIDIVDKGEMSILEIRSMARQHAARHDLDIVVVDYLQLMSGRGDNREQEVSSISRGLKALAMELRVPVVAISQLNRGVEARTEKRPMLSDLRESGGIEQDADQVLMLYREGYYAKGDDRPDPEYPEEVEVAVTKNRNGPTGMVKLLWTGIYTRFDSIETRRETPPPFGGE